MNPAVTTRNLSKRYRDVTALDQISCSLQENTIYGLLGRNGAGKTTLMRILTGQSFATAGELSVLGGHPYENEAVLSQVCFLKESQTYPRHFRVRHALAAARLLFPNWDESFAQSLLADFDLPPNRLVHKLSRGMLSTLGIIIGLAARAPLTLFDEPYLGLDAVARQRFYDHLVIDYAEHPRTIVLSTHLIDEVSELIEHVLLLDHGRLLVNEATETLRGQMIRVVGPVSAVDELAGVGTELHRERIGGLVRATLRGAFGPAQRDRVNSLGLRTEPVSLQELVVQLTTGVSPNTQRTAAAVDTTMPKELPR